MAAFHELEKTISDKELNAITEQAAVFNHLVYPAYERIQELVEFFTDFLESGKSEAILLQKYLREDDKQFSSELYRDTKKQFVEYRNKNLAKSLNDQKYKPSGREPPGRGTGNNNASNKDGKDGK